MAETKDNNTEQRGYQPTGKQNFGYQPNKSVTPPPPPKTGSVVQDAKKDK